MAKKTEKLRGPDLLCAAVNQIIAHPETWDQKEWHCKTTHCVGGWCETLGDKPTENPFENARGLLGISFSDASYLFDAGRTLPEIYMFAKIYRAGFDRDGFDRAGFDRAGFNRDGFNRDGFDRAGFDRAGFNRSGFDRAGFNRDGKKLELVPFEIESAK